MRLIKLILISLFFCTILFSVAVASYNSNSYAIKQVKDIGALPLFFTYHNTDGTKVATDNVKKNDTRKSNSSATIKSEISKNSIKRVWVGSNGLLYVEADIKDDKNEVKILVFNMLGKEVRKIFNGMPTEKNADGFYIFDSKTAVNLPKNVYILVIQGYTFKIADRFVVAT